MIDNKETAHNPGWNAALVEAVRVVNGNKLVIRNKDAEKLASLLGMKGALAKGAVAVAVQGPDATGLIIDATGTELRTALYPRILDENGHVVFSSAMVVKEKGNSINGYALSISEAKEIPRVGTKPMVIKVMKLSDENSDVVISHADANKIAKRGGMKEALHHARVVFALGDPKSRTR